MAYILIVDDEPNVLKELPKTFTKYYPSSEVHTAHSFKTAEELLAKNRYDIVMLDGELSERITNPWQHAFGYHLIEPIRASESSKAKIIMISSSEDTNKKGLALGADLHLSKKLFFQHGKVVRSLNLEFFVEEGL